MQTLVLKARRHGAAEFGIVSRFSDDNYRYRSGKIPLVELLRRAEIAKIRWQATCPHMLDEVRICFEDDSPLPNVTYIPSGMHSDDITENKRIRGRPRKNSREKPFDPAASML